MPGPSIQLIPIGAVRREGDEVWLAVEERYRPGLLELDRFSHVVVLWWASGHDNDESRAIMQTDLPYAPGVRAGVFACRAEYRPNPIATTTCKLLDVDIGSGRIRVAAIDAYDGSPLLDVKPYIGVVDRVEHITVPDWYEGWPEWMPDEGIGLYEEE
jgi:tRNA (Thr-GGU) A37 N-methylase